MPMPTDTQQVDIRLPAPGEGPGGLKPASWEDIIRATAKSQKVNPELALAVAQRESSMNPEAVSPKGALGLFQLMPATAAELGVDPSNPVENIRGGITYLRQLSDRYGGDLTQALSAYNAGPGNVAAGNIPQETQTYVSDILADLRRRAQERAGGAQPAPAAPQAQPEAVAAPGGAETPQRPSLMENVDYVARQTLPLAGMAIGGAMGLAAGAPTAAVSGPVGPATAAVLGAGAGTGVGEAVYLAFNTLEQKLGLLPQGGEMSAGEAVGQVGEAVNEGMVTEMLGQTFVRTLAPVGKAIFQPFRKRLTRYAQEAFETFPPKVKQWFLPSEVSESRALNIAENVAEGSILGGEDVTKVKMARQAEATRQATNVARTLGEEAAPTAAGEGARAKLQSNIKTWRSIERPAWNQAGEAAAGIPMAAPRTTQYVAELTGQQAGAIAPNAGVTAAVRVAQLAGEGGEVAAVQATKAAQKQLGTAVPESIQLAIRRAVQAPEAAVEGALDISAGQFQETVKGLNRLVRTLTKAAELDPGQYNAQLGIAKRLLGLAKDDLRATLASNPRALALYDRATVISRLGSESFYSDAVNRLLRSGKLPPSQIAERLVRPHAARDILQIQRAIGKEAMQPIRRAAIEGILSPNARTGQLDWGALAQRLQRLDDATLKALFPEGQGEALKKLSRLMLNLGRQPAGGIGRTGIMLTQWGPAAGALGAIATGNVPAGMGIILTPKVMSRIMSSKMGLQWLTYGIQAPLGSDVAVKAAVYLTRLLQREIQEEGNALEAERQSQAVGQ